MSVSSLPEWKQLLLERKRREEEERDRREREEEERLASMPAWKRGIIQRRRAKQEGGERDREREREGGFQAVDSADGESYILTQAGGEMTITLEPERCELLPLKAFGRVSMENIGPVRQNPFIKSQSGWRKNRESEKGVDVQDAERGGGSWGQDKEMARGRAIETKTERYRDRSEGRERDRSLGRESGKDRAGERDKENMRIAKEGQKDPDTTLFPLVPGLRTIKAENIIIIEKDRRGSEREENIVEKIAERERERQQEEEEEKDEGSEGGGGEKRGMRMDLREILAGGGSVTEIRATEVLIIKPGGADDRATGAKMAARGVEDEEECQVETERQEVQRQRDRRSSSEGGVDGERERPREVSRPADQERQKEKASIKEPAVWPRPQREEREFSSNTSITGSANNNSSSSSSNNSENSGLLERGGRVSQLLSKFGEHPKHPKPPSRSKSSECFKLPSRERTGREGSSDELSQAEEGQGEREALRGVPKRSFSFSDRVISTKENGLLDDSLHERRAVERTFSDRRTGERPERGTKPKVLLRWMHGDKQAKHDDKMERSAERQSEIERDPMKKPKIDKVSEPVKESPTGQVAKVTQDEVFTVASIKNTEGVAFARKVSIRQEGKEKAVEREAKRNENVTEGASEKLAERFTELELIEREMERDRMIEREKEWERQIERQIEEKKQSSMWRAEAESKPPQCMCIHSSEMVNSAYVPSSPSSIMVSAATEFSNVPRSPTIKDTDIGGRPDWDSPESQEHQTVLSQHTEDLISKIGRVQDKKSERDNRRRTQTCVYVDGDVTCNQEFPNADVHSPEDEVVDSSIDSPYDGYSGGNCKEEPLVLKSPKRSISVPDEIQIPRTVFYGVDMPPERSRVRLPSTDGPEGGIGGEEVGGKGLERRESWKAGRPLTRIESLREKIRQQELEKQRAKDAGMADGESGEREKKRERRRDAAQERAAEERRKMGWEIEGGGERDATVVVSITVNERRQEETLQLASSPFDVTQELGVSRASPQLPVPLSLSQPLSAEEQDSRDIYTACTPIATYSDRTEDVEVEELTQHVEELSGENIWRHQDRDTPQGFGSEEDERGGGGGGEELPDEDYLPPSQTSSPSSSLPPSPTLSCSQDAMSRIYNLKAVSSRTRVCISERPVEVVSHKTLPHEDYRPFRPKSSPEPTCHPEVKVEHPWESSDEPLSVLSVQRQVEQLRLREQEARRLAEKNVSSEKEIKVSPGQQREETQQLHPGDGQTRNRSSPTGPRTPPPTVRAQPRPNQTKAFSGPSPENARKHLERPSAPVPPSSPSTLSPSPTLTLSPSPSPSPPLFSIRSASSGPGKRGTTITITPRKPAAPAAATAATTAAAAPSPGSPSTSKPSGQTQTPAPNGTGEGGKKRYPTAEEIQVIGGYQNLEKSCLVKSRGTTNKGVKVCFDEAQLERVCEYPSENSMLAAFPPSPRLGPDLGREDRGKGQEEEEEEEEEERERTGGGGGISKNVGSAVGRVLRVDESCRR